MAENGLTFAKQAGIVAAAVLAVISLGNTLGGLAMRMMVLPEIERVLREERVAREKADARITHAILQLSADREKILEVLETQRTEDRRRLVQELRRNWKPKAE